MQIPDHIAIIMDGNGRWAKARFLPRIAGHKQGVEAVRTVVKACVKKKIAILTLWAFSSENWQRPVNEVNFLLSLILHALKEDVLELHKNNICLKVIGDRKSFSAELQTAMSDAEQLTQDNTGLRLNIALNYGGRWDIVQAARKLSEKVLRAEMTPGDITENTFQDMLSLAPLPDPDLLIRTSGEERISNYLLWQCAYTEFYFTDVLWPDFTEAEFDKALQAYASRQRRFGSITEKDCMDA